MSLGLTILSEVLYVAFMILVGWLVGGAVGARWGYLLTGIIGVISFAAIILLGIRATQANPTPEQAVKSILDLFSLENMTRLVAFVVGEAFGEAVTSIGSGRRTSKDSYQ